MTDRRDAWLHGAYPRRAALRLPDAACNPLRAHFLKQASESVQLRMRRGQGQWVPPSYRKPAPPRLPDEHCEGENRGG